MKIEPADLLRHGAVPLFAARAAAVLPGFALDAGNGAAVASVCRALDGDPAGDRADRGLDAFLVVSSARFGRSWQLTGKGRET